MGTVLKTINIKGKKYVEVNQRIKYFRENYKDWRLTSTVIELTDVRAVIQANIFDEKERLVATGLAYEMAGSSFINETSYIENCETSAWGRALGNFGIGIDISVASYDEVVTAINNQDKKTIKKPAPILEDKLNSDEANTKHRKELSNVLLSMSKNKTEAILMLKVVSTYNVKENGKMVVVEGVDSTAKLSGTRLMSSLRKAKEKYVELDNLGAIPKKGGK